jgi:hypothetical protein
MIVNIFLVILLLVLTFYFFRYMILFAVLFVSFHLIWLGTIWSIPLGILLLILMVWGTNLIPSM